ncbi:MAG: hypothetical protein JW760_14270 [Spirochaetales bacterium]|nr:hypothetical protein [Spirochaetales bacterium]
MKKFFFVIVLIFLAATFLPAEAGSDTNLKISISKAVEEFSRIWLELHPDPVSKQGIAVLEIENNSEKAQSAKIGRLIRAYLEEAMDRSLIFVLTDRENLENILEEITFSAGGMVSDDSAVQIGELTGTAALISGSVVEEGSDFRIQLKLTAIETGEVVAVTGFSLPQKELVEASTELEYTYVAANGIGLTVKPQAYLYGAETFNKFNPMFLDIAVKYRPNRSIMLSAGILKNLITTMDLYRWDPSEYPDQERLVYSDVQPDLPFPSLTDDEIGQITGAFSGGTGVHLDFQYTLNITPFFNVGINVGILGFLRPVLTVLYGSSGDLYFNDSGYDDGGLISDGELTDIAQKDKMPMEYVFNSLLGGKIELCPEFFITPRMALSGTVGYMYTFPMGLREVLASERQWAYYSSAIESNYNEGAIEKYYGFNPLYAPGGGEWSLDLSGFYAGLSLSVFF